MTQLLQPRHKAQLIANFRDKDSDHVPVVKLFLTAGSATWLLTDIDPENENIAFGLCDIGQGCAELGCVDLSEIEEAISSKPVFFERDYFFKAKATISVYAQAGRTNCEITEKDDDLVLALLHIKQAAQKNGDELRGRLLSDEESAQHFADFGSEA